MNLLTRKTEKLLLAAISLILILGCDATTENDRDMTGGDSDTDTDTDADVDAGDETDVDAGDNTDTDDHTGSGAGCTAMDILFVIDDSGSMAEEQSNLLSNFPKFVEVLEDYQTESSAPLEYRLGVTTTGVKRSFTQKLPPPFPAMPMTSAGPNGALVGGSCGFPDAWIDGPGPEVSSDFSCAAGVGTGGSGTEMPFAALQLALGDRMAPGSRNEGFYRKDENSLLVVVIITDEDDCSVANGGTVTTTLAGGSDCDENRSIGLYEVEETKLFLDDVTGGPGRYVVVGIGGQKVCSSAFGEAAHARRLHRLVDLCADYGVHGDICTADLWLTLEEALNVMGITCDNMPPPV